MDFSNVNIIIARYNESLNWTLEYPFNQFSYIVYNKGSNDNFEKIHVSKIINLPNVGRCDHTYLYHIINNFENLSEVNVFFPGSIQMENKKNKAIDILNRIIKNNCKEAVFIASYSKNIFEDFKSFVLDNWKASDPQNCQVNNENVLKKSVLRPFGKWFRYHFGNIIVNYRVENSIFAVHKNDIIKHPVSRYQRLIVGLSTHSNPEVGHYCERAWGAIFFPLVHTKLLIC
jgi:hypothetical protein